MSAENSAAGGAMAAGMGAAMGLGMAQNAGPWGTAPSAPPAPPAAPTSPLWHIATNGESTGPFDTATLTQMAAKGTLTAATQVWTPGQDGWKAAGTTALNAILNQTPPPAPKG